MWTIIAAGHFARTSLSFVPTSLGGMVCQRRYLDGQAGRPKKVRNIKEIGRSLMRLMILMLLELDALPRELRDLCRELQGRQP